MLECNHMKVSVVLVLIHKNLLFVIKMFMPRVISSLLPKFINQNVKLLAQFIEVDEANSIAKVRDCANVHVYVYNFKITRISNDDWIEIIGISNGKNHIHAITIKIQPLSDFVDFDKDIYVETISLLQADFSQNNFIIYDNATHWGAIDHVKLLHKEKESMKNDELMENILGDDNLDAFAL